MYSINVTNIQPAINKFSSASMVLVDLNNTNGEACDEVIYLIEPSTIKLNKMTLLNKDIFDEIYGKRIVLNKSLLTDQDVSDFEFESHSKVSYNMPPLNDRADNSQIIKDFINKFYNQKQFNFIYSQWLNNNKTSRTFYDLYKPSIDHILPKSKGGTNDLDNLQFLTVFENLCKRDMTAEEWILFKKENNIKGDIFLEGVVL